MISLRKMGKGHIYMYALPILNIKKAENSPCIKVFGGLYIYIVFHECLHALHLE